MLIIFIFCMIYLLIMSFSLVNVVALVIFAKIGVGKLYSPKK